MCSKQIPAISKPGADVIHRVTHGDPDWLPMFSATLQAGWSTDPDLRVVVQGIGDDDIAVYFGQWQRRTNKADEWKPVTPMRHTWGRMWFPSDFGSRGAMSQTLLGDRDTASTEFSVEAKLVRRPTLIAARRRQPQQCRRRVAVATCAGVRRPA